MFRTAANFNSAGCLAAIFAIAACASEPAQQSAAPLEVAPPKSGSEIVTEPLPQKKSLPPALTARRAEPPPQEPQMPDKLLGLTGQSVAQILGPANFVRRDKGVEIWQYVAPQCVLDVFLYPKADGLAVKHFDMRAGEQTSLNRAACYGEFLSRPSKQS